MIRHHFTVDVEEYFQVSAFERHVSPARWDGFESRVRGSVHRLLEMLERHQARATFFVLGWIADRHPALVRDIVSAGHEVASHGWGHERVATLTPDGFRESVRRSRETLEALAARPVFGYRAPSFSIVRGCEWALATLVDEGYRYDSSLFPVRRRGYGYHGGRRDPHWIEAGSGRILEVPPATVRRLGRVWPAGGGAYFRLLPYAVVRAGLREAGRRGVPATFYIHPWELDPAQPRFAVPWLTRVRHYGGLGRTVRRLERLLSEFRFGTIGEYLAAVDRTAGQTSAGRAV